MYIHNGNASESSEASSSHSQLAKKKPKYQISLPACVKQVQPYENTDKNKKDLDK
jgi:hypothetical protein